jgi:hypothetical protein
MQQWTVALVVRWLVLPCLAGVLLGKLVTLALLALP